MHKPYIPCAIGVHVCGIDIENWEPFTEDNYPCRTAEEARKLFEEMKAECFVEDYPMDFCVDLNISDIDGQVEDFPISRQAYVSWKDKRNDR